MNTSSDVAAKEYDSILTQLCGWYEDETSGGIEGATKRMLDADPTFILGHALHLELNLMGALTSPRLDLNLSNSIVHLNNLIKAKPSKDVSEQERLHVDVVNYWSNSQLKQATLALERLSTLYPEDVSALKMNQDTYFMLGTALQMRNSLASSLATMNKKNPLKGYVHGMFSFALEESNMYPLAEMEALEAIKLIPNDTWAIHNYAHCLEMQAKHYDGLKWMKDKKPDWLPCQTLACHQYWHTALFNINNDNLSDAIYILDQEVLTRCKDRSTSLDLHDAASMLYRMELVDLFGLVETSFDANKKKDQKRKRWSNVYEMCKPHKRDHLLGFNDAHFIMAFLGMEDSKTARELIDTIDETPSLNEAQTVVKPLLEAMYEFHCGHYDKCVQLLEPIRFDIIRIGGSHAQRDVFEQLLLVAALKSPVELHQKLGQRMILERETMHGGKRVRQTQLLANQANN